MAPMALDDKNRADLLKIQTFVFLDIETTGLPSLSFGKCSITELAMWVTRRDDLQTSSNSPTRRLLNKWSLLFNPAMAISNDSTRITGLDNFMLENYNTFDSNACDTITSYLNHFPKPICFVAHNGDGFDYPIIKTAFTKRGKIMPDFVWCCDSLPMFKELDAIEQRLLEVADREQEFATNDLNVDESVKEYTDDFLNCELFESSDEQFKARQRINETTPRRNKQITVKRQNHQRDEYFGDEATSTGTTTKRARKELFPPRISGYTSNPVRQIAEEILAGKAVFKAPKQTAATTAADKNKTNADSSPRKSFRLPDIYERVFKQKPIISHTAEADVHTLYKLVRHYGDEFVELADKMAVPFACVNDKPKA